MKSMDGRIMKLVQYIGFHSDVSNVKGASLVASF